MSVVFFTFYSVIKNTFFVFLNYFSGVGSPLLCIFTVLNIHPYSSIGVKARAEQKKTKRPNIQTYKVAHDSMLYVYV